MLPFPLDAGNTLAKTPDEKCVSNMWYLLGVNNIPGRVKRRGKLEEQMEFEQRDKRPGEDSLLLHVCLIGR